MLLIDIQSISLHVFLHFIQEMYYLNRYKAADGTKYSWQVAFQVLIQPACYKVGGETVGAKSRIDPIYPNSKLEWSTNKVDTNYLNGLLVKLQKL